MSRGRELRPSNKERAPYEQALGQAYAEGRLDLATYEERMLQVAGAISVGQLEECVGDVPFTLHTERAVAARSSRSRRTFLGLVGLAAVGGASSLAGRMVPESTAPPPEPEPTPGTPTSQPSPTITPGMVSTTMAQVPFGTPDAFAILAGHLSDLGITAVHRVAMWGKFVSVAAVRASEPVDVLFRTGWAPKIDPTDPTGTPTLPPESLAGLDSADLLERTGALVALGDEPRIDVRWYLQQWVIAVSGSDETVYWDIQGQRLEL